MTSTMNNCLKTLLKTLQKMSEIPSNILPTKRKTELNELVTTGARTSQF